MTIHDHRDAEPMEYDAADGRCSGCGFIRPLKGGICRQCSRERAAEHDVQTAPAARGHQSRGEQAATRAELRDLERKAFPPRAIYDSLGVVYQEGRLW